MKLFIGKILLFIAIMRVADAALGMFFKPLVPHAKGGDTKRIEYICHHTSEELVVFGSSRAVHHYDPQIIEDSLHLTAYNCGKNGNGIILLYGWYKLMQKRYQPKYIIYDIMPSFDLLEGDNMTFLPSIRYYYDEPPIDSIFWSVDAMERYKMLSYAYRYNSQFFQLIIDNIKPLREDIKGYRPLQGTINYEPKPASPPQSQAYSYDPLKLYYLERLVKDCQTAGTQLIFAVSPRYKNKDATVLAPLYDLCKRYNLPLIDHYTDEAFNLQKTYFRDSAHMNQEGAAAYTRTVVAELKSCCTVAQPPEQ